jgi:hypothetical protein
VILIALVGGSILSRVAGSGTFAETAARIAASERLYRVALSTVLIATLGSTLLAFALYAMLRPVNRQLAQLGMIFSLEDSKNRSKSMLINSAAVNLWVTIMAAPQRGQCQTEEPSAKGSQVSASTSVEQWLDTSCRDRAKWEVRKRSARNPK